MSQPTNKDLLRRNWLDLILLAAFAVWAWWISVVSDMVMFPR